MYTKLTLSVTDESFFCIFVGTQHRTINHDYELTPRPPKTAT
nr:MAG TPA: hypothetical protein [Caudoviricetes sp.]